MIRKKVYSPILFLTLLVFICSCNNYIKDESKEFYLLKSKGDTLNKKKQLDSAYFYYNLAKENCKDKNGENYAYVLLQIATLQQHVGDLFDSEETVTEALANYKGTLYIPYLYNILAVTYDKQNKYDDALQYYKKAYNTFQDDTAKAIAQNNIGLIFREKGQYQKAIQTFKPLLKNPYLKPHKDQVARVMDNLGYTQFKINSPEAYYNLSESLRLRDSLQDIIGCIPSNIHLSEYFKNTDKLKAQQYAENALLLAKKINSPEDKLESLKWLIEGTELTTVKQYIKLNDSLNLSRNSAKNRFAKSRYDSTTALKNVEIQKGQKYLYLILLLSVILVSTLLYFLIRTRNKNKLKIISYETETRLAKKIHDELANDVFNSLTFAETQDLQDKEKKESFLQSMEKIYGKTRNISNENSEIETGDGFEAFLKEMITSYNSEQVTVIMKDNKDINWNSVNKQKKVAIYRVLQELLVNMKKYSKCRFAVISFEKNRNTIEITYSDNGVGVAGGLIKKNGLQNVETRIKTIKGTITFETEADNGFKAKIII
jgi:tetratricopeptide (TPR) repeat protein